MEFQHDINLIGSVQAELKALKLQTAHLVCVGGWNAPHPDTRLSPTRWWNEWKEWNEWVENRDKLTDQSGRI